jgi:hypothetical protein
VRFIVFQKSLSIIAAVLIVSAVGFAPKMVRVAQASECSSSDRIDASSADSARRKMEKAGFLQVHDLKKGCDNFWHGQGAKDGAETRIVLSPQGDVLTEGN